MQTAISRLRALEAALALDDESLRGFIALESGADPLPALVGKGPGLYLFLDAVTDGARFLARVHRLGGVSVERVGGEHGTH